MDQQSITLLEQCVDAWHKEELTTLSAMIMVDSIINPVKITHEDIEWALSQVK